MHYVADVNLAFLSLDLVGREVWKGWVIRFFHILGASSFFMFMYFHVGRGLYFFSFLLLKTWMRGVIIMILSMAVAFLGYVLPWGQMSYWGATVITKFFSVVPVVGSNLVIWIWGGFAVDYPTLTRFFSLHFLFPLLLVVLVGFHLMFLHETGSNKPLGVERSNDKIYFSPLFLLKDVWGFSFFFFVAYIFFFSPTIFLEYQNYIEANPLVTPTHIQPEWYFLPAYAVLRSIPKKLGGVLALVLFIAILLVVPLLKNKNLNSVYRLRRGSFKFFYQVFFWIWIWNFLFLVWIGACPVEYPFLQLSRISSIIYFLYYFIFLFI